MAKKTTQAYTEEFRREAVKRAEKPGVTTASVARELGVGAHQITALLWALGNIGYEDNHRN